MRKGRIGTDEYVVCLTIGSENHWIEVRVYFDLIGEDLISGMLDSIFELRNRKIAHADMTYFAFLVELHQGVEYFVMTDTGIWSMEEDEI